jgi:hypothetical protein
VNKKELEVSEKCSPSGLTGSCLCGGVSYRIEGEVRGVINCFCTQCQKTSGHHVAATRVKQQNLIIERKQTLSWYTSTPGCQRGFCKQCGGNLFWRKLSENYVSVMAGTLDKPTGLHTIENIFVDDASDYFEIQDIGSDSDESI